MGIKVVVCDLFGTLINMGTVLSPYRRVFESARESGHAFADVRRSILTRDLPEPTDLVTYFGLRGFDAEEFVANIQAELRSVALYPEVPGVLEWVRVKGLKITLISNLASPYKYAFYSLGLDKFIESPVFSCDVACMKPECQIYEIAAIRLGVRLDEMLMVGDSRPSDVDGPRAAGMHSLHLQRDNEKESGEYLRSLSELKNLTYFV
jgi:FMN phosphatase YigB (HAD superfamily)